MLGERPPPGRQSHESGIIRRASRQDAQQYGDGRPRAAAQGARVRGGRSPGRRVDRDRRLDPRPPRDRPPGSRGLQAAVGLLQSAGIPVEMGTAGMATAFKAELAGSAQARGRGSPSWPSTTRCPGSGHGCGHNLIGTSAIGAGLALAGRAARARGLDLGARHAGRGERRAELGRQGAHGQRRACSTTSTRRSCSTRAPRRP